MSEETDRSKVLGRLLGPDEPELSCEQCFEELDRFVELELAGQDAEARIPGMQAHLQGCPACAEDYASLREFVAAGRRRP
jgi:anti-sigma factor RsiW